jgi:hypothetical protein
MAMIIDGKYHGPNRMIHPVAMANAGQMGEIKYGGVAKYRPASTVMKTTRIRKRNRTEYRNSNVKNRLPDIVVT